jgi:hypothetical protein
VDSRRFAPPSAKARDETRRRLKLRDDGPVVGFFGKRGSNDDDRKGTDVFVRSIVELGRMLPHAQVLIVGPGWQQLVGEFHRAGINCAWIPFVPSVDELAPLHGALDFYWVTARVEGGPVPLLEAMSTAVACLTTPVGLARDIVDGGNALLLSKDPDAPFAQLTAELWCDPQRRAEMGRRGRNTILSQMRDSDTSTEVYRAYEIASDFFASRMSGRRQFSIRRQSLAAAATLTDDLRTDPPLHGIPESRHRQLRMLESLAWAENLVLYQQQRAAALSLIWKAWRANPTSIQPPRILLRRFLPATVVRGVVGLKRRLLSRSRSVAGSAKGAARS